MSRSPSTTASARSGSVWQMRAITTGLSRTTPRSGGAEVMFAITLSPGSASAHADASSAMVLGVAGRTSRPPYTAGRLARR
jgi:hypothetical protein